MNEHKVGITFEVSKNKSAMTIIDALKDRDSNLEIKHKSKTLYWNEFDNCWMVAKLHRGVYKYILDFDNEEQAVAELLKG